MTGSYGLCTLSFVYVLLCMQFVVLFTITGYRRDGHMTLHLSCVVDVGAGLGFESKTLK